MKKSSWATNEACWAGAAEAFRYGCPDAPEVNREDMKRVVEARDVFAGFTNQQAALSLLILMYDLGRRLEYEQTKTPNPR